VREEVEEPLLVGVRSQIADAVDSLRENKRLAAWCEQCTKCDLDELYRDVPALERRHDARLRPLGPLLR
jgi:hypothetical protein